MQLGKSGKVIQERNSFKTRGRVGAMVEQQGGLPCTWLAEVGSEAPQMVPLVPQE